MTQQYDLPLPPPRRVPMPEEVWVSRLRGLPVRQLARETAGDLEIRYVARTGTWVDVGGWTGPRPVQVLVTPHELIMLASGWLITPPRPVVARLPLRQAFHSVYNHVSGRLALAPAPDVSIRALKVSPIVGYQILSQIHHEGA